MKLKPLDDRIVVKPQEAEAVTAGGIVLPEAAKEKPLMGKVVAVGDGKMLDSGQRGKMSVKKNDVVLYGKYGGSDIEMSGVEYKILREDEVLGIVEK
jgi:chaperonin GroES